MRYASIAELKVFTDIVAGQLIGIREIVISEELFNRLAEDNLSRMFDREGDGIVFGGLRFRKESLKRDAVFDE